MGGPGYATQLVPHPGDWLLVEPHGEFLRVVRQTPNDLEAERFIRELESQGRTFFVLKVKGVVGRG